MTAMAAAAQRVCFLRTLDRKKRDRFSALDKTVQNEIARDWSTGRTGSPYWLADNKEKGTSLTCFPDLGAPRSVLLLLEPTAWWEASSGTANRKVVWNGEIHWATILRKDPRCHAEVLWQEDCSVSRVRVENIVE